MKLYPIKLIATSLVILVSCNKLKKMVDIAKQQDLTVTPSPLELHGTQVKFEMSAILPQKMLPSGMVYTLSSFYQYGTKTEELKDLEFNADDFPNSSTTTSRLAQEYIFEYADGMEHGELRIKGFATDPRNGKSLETPDTPTVAVGLIMTSKLHRLLTKIPGNSIEGLRAIDSGKYHSALSLLPTDSSTTTIFLRGLAFLMLKENENCQTIVKRGIELNEKNIDFGAMYYLLAVSHARQSSEAQLVKNLQEAVKINPELKDLAVSDLEFNKFANSVKQAL